MTTQPFYRQCTGKRTYIQKKDAKHQAKLTMAMNRGGLINVYRCDICDHWHLGHRPKVKPPVRERVRV